MATVAEKRDWLADVETGIVQIPTAALIYGVPGIGKTSLAAAIPGCVFLTDDRERGVETLKASKLVKANTPVFPPATTWSEAADMIRSLVESDHKYKCLVIDTVNGLERLAQEHCVRSDFAGDWGETGFSGFGRGYARTVKYWHELLNQFDLLRQKGLSVVCLAHSEIVKQKNPEGDDWDRFAPALHKSIYGATARWADMVLFLKYDTEVEKDRQGKVKAYGGQERIMHTEYRAGYEAKNRHGLPTEIPMGASGAEAWKNLREAMKGGK